MRLFFCSVVAIAVACTSVLADIPIEAQIAIDLMDHLGLSEGGTNIVSSDWDAPIQFMFASNLVHTSELENGGGWALATNNCTLGIVSHKGYQTEMQSRLAWALCQTTCSAPPTDYFDTFISEAKSEHLVMIFQGAMPVLTNRANASVIHCLWNNHIFKFESKEGHLSCGLFCAFLEAGGIPIPDDPPLKNPAVEPDP